MNSKQVCVNHTSFSDGVLCEGSRIGDADAFAELYRRYLNSIYRFLFRRTGGNIALSEDLTSQVFLDALDNLPHYHERSSFAAWLFTIARRRLADHYRNGKMYLLDEIPDELFGISDRSEDRENMEHLKQLLSVLDEEKRELLQLRFSAELSFSDMAVVLGKSEAAVKMSLYRVLDWLRGQWEAGNE
ncbi:MAG: sigma-70 family RNA polymerase sigma factor [Anaerolineales bacterium]|nr:sigma-70 family RNA polymerase sigma factor [Anaerolineales bacterium]